MIFWWPSLFEGAAAHLKTIPLEFIFVALVIQLCLWLVQALAWKETVSVLQNKEIDFRSALVHLGALVTGKYLPGKIWGMVVRAGILSQSGVTIGSTFRITAYEQITILASGMLVFLIGYAMSSVSWFQISAIGMIIVVLACLPLLIKFLEMTGRFFVESEKENQEELSIETTAHLSATKLYWLVGLQSLAWILQGLIVVILASGLFNKPIGTAPLLIASNSLASLIGFIAVFAPGGIGVREAAFGFLLRPEFEIESIITIALVLRLWTMSADIVLGIYSAATFNQLARYH